MSSLYPNDCLAVVNGPEDGGEFPLIRAPFHIGRDSKCAVCLTLDNTIQPEHAHLSAASGGYRVRCLTSSPVYVDEKRVGFYRSRILKSGAALQVGHTLLALHCAPEGLATRSTGLVSENDFVYALRQIVRKLLSVFSDNVLFWIRGHWKLILILGHLAAYVFYPPFRQLVHNVVLNLLRR